MQNLKDRLKTFDSDLDRVKKAAIKIQKDLNAKNPKNEEEDQTMIYQANVQARHISRSNSFVFDDNNPQIVSDLKMAASEWYDLESL